MRIVVLALPFVLLALPVAARDCDGVGPIIAIRADGVPVYTHQDPDVYQSVVDSVRPNIGDRPADKPILAVDTRNNGVAWVSRDQLKQFVDMTEASLRESLVYKGPSHCRPKDIPWEFHDPAEPGRTPIELPEGRPVPAPIDLFPDEPDGPRSGLWRAIPGTPEMRGCPAMMQAMAGQLATPVPPEALLPRRLDLKAPFHPDQLEMTTQMQAGLGTQMNWVSNGKASWQAEILPEIFGQIPAGGGAGSTMIWVLTVRSDTEIAHDVTINIVLPEVSQQVMGGGLGPCQVITRNLWQRVGD